MSNNSQAENALRLAGGDEHAYKVEDFYPAPFPDDVPTIQLEKISLSKLLNGDGLEAQRVFDICTSTGFFYLDMLDHPTGRQLWQNVCKVCHRGRERLVSTPTEEKLKYKPLGGVRVFDRGYLLRTADQAGESDLREILNIPQSEFFGTKIEGGGIPSWISPDEDLYRQTLSGGNKVANTILGLLEKQIDLPAGSFTNLHRLYDDSGDFIRVLRYPGTSKPYDAAKEGPDGFPAHKDALSIAILFTWLGGLQIPDPDARVEGLAVKPEDWRWVRPEPGYAVVNLGDAMEIFTQKVLRSGIHRVVKAPGAQRPHDRMSVLIATRPENNALMKPIKWPNNAAENEQTEQKPVMTSLEWGNSIVRGIQKRVQEEAKARGTSVLANG